MATFTLSVVGYLSPSPKLVGLTLAQVRTVLERHSEVYPARVRQALAWAEQASSGESWESDTDPCISDQANVYLTKE
jgi:hypothetical protein